MALKRSQRAMQVHGTVLVLNASYEPINVIPRTRAVVLIMSGKAESLLDSDDMCSSGDRQTNIVFPSVIRLTYMADVPRTHQVPLSRKALFQRDNFTCQYCGDKPAKLEVEHVVPRSRGGRNVWKNVTTACRGCNAHKRDRTPEEAGMRLRTKPYAPNRIAMIASRQHADWDQFLSGMVAA